MEKLDDVKAPGVRLAPIGLLVDAVVSGERGGLPSVVVPEHVAVATRRLVSETAAAAAADD